MKIGILSRNSQLYSTRRLVEAAKARGHEVRVIDHAKCYVLMAKGEPKVMYRGEFLDDLDAVVPRIGASVTFFGASVVRQFELKGVFTANTSQAITRSRDKLRSLQVLSREGVGIPRTAYAKFPKNKDVDELIRQVGGAPLVIKLLEGTQGLGVVLADTDQAARSIIEAFSGLKANILLQEFVAESKGADIRAFVVNGEVVGAMKRQGREGEFRSNLHRGGSANVIELTKTERSAAIKAAKALQLGVAGVDMLQSRKGPYIIEVNSSPGLQGIEGATQVDIAGKIIEYVEKGAKKKKKA
jgi:ribosomal protein S6--L-glutamate ligase